MLVTRVTKSISSLLIMLLCSMSVTVSANTPQDSSATTAQSVSAQRQLLMQRLEQLEADNDRLRQQLSRVQSSDESVRSLEKVLQDHSALIDNLRNAQMAKDTAVAGLDSAEVTFQAQTYEAPATGVSKSTSGLTSVSPAERVITPAPASVISLEMAGASGVLALIGALVLLFVITILRKSYWMPRQCLVKRPAAHVSEKGLAADLAAGYVHDSRAQASRDNSQDSAEPVLSDQEQARRDRQAMARVLEQGLALSDDDQALMTDTSESSDTAESAQAQAPVVATKPKKQTTSKRAKTQETATANAVAPRGPLKQAKNPLSGEYDLLGSNDFDGDFFENDEFDDLFEQAAHVPEGKDVSESKRRSDEDVLQSIREKTFGYVAPVVDDGAYIVEEGCDDLDKYMDIAFIETPIVEMDEAREHRGRRA